MKLLLDTQIALWWLRGDRRLVKATRIEIEKAQCVISVASIWEVAIKHRIGKLSVSPHVFRDAMAGAGARILPISDEHAVREASLETSHPDPFDRLLLAVAVTEQMTLLTADTRLQAQGGIGVIKTV